MTSNNCFNNFPPEISFTSCPNIGSPIDLNACAKSLIGTSEGTKPAGLVPSDVPINDLAQALRSIGEPIFGQEVKDISGGKLLKQLFDVTEKFNMQTQPQLLMLQKTMVVVEGVARKLNPNTNIWTTSKPVLENWLRETKDPIKTINETLNTTSEVIKRLPEFPETQVIFL